MLKKYHAYLLLEKSLSKNTIDAYKRDLNTLLEYLEQIDVDVLDVKKEHLVDFLIELCNIGIQPRTQARVVSGIKSFYKFYKNIRSVWLWQLSTPQSAITALIM